MEVQVQLGLLGARVWPQCLGAELPWVDADTDKAAEGDMETDTGADRSSSMEPERSGPMELERSSPTEMDSSIPMGLERSSSLGPGRSSPMEMDRRSPMEVKRRSDMGPDRSSSMGPGKSTPVEASPQQRVPAGRAHSRAAPGPCRAGRCLQECCARLWHRLKGCYVELGRSNLMAAKRSSSMGPGSTIPAAPVRSTPAEPSPRQRVPMGRASGRAAPGPCRAGRCLREGCAQLWRCLKACWKRCCRPCRIRFSKPPCWQRWSQKTNGFPSS